MTTSALMLLALFFALLLPMAWGVGQWLVWVERRPWASWEHLIYRTLGIQPQIGMSWQTYALSLLIFNGLGVLTVFTLQRLQDHLPLNPQHLAAVPADLAFNTAVSFVTNTNWQNYGGEYTLSYLVQAGALTVQNFLSAATGIAVAFALMRGLAARSSSSIGNFWVDITRITGYILLPFSLIFALFLISQGVPQNFKAYQVVTPIESVSPSIGQHMTSHQQTRLPSIQTIAMGPVASQVAIKMLGTNGGGFFNANSAHPYENPTPLTNLFQMLSIFLLPAALYYAFGEILGDRRQGWTLLGTVSGLFAFIVLGVFWAEQHAHPFFASLGIDQQYSAWQAGGNMEGKEVRFGIAASALFSAVTTAASCGAVNAMHDSFTPLGGLVPLWLIQSGEVIFGGVGSGFYGLLVFALLAVFIAGLMIGRTPEYLGKKIEIYEMKMITLIILIVPLLVLGGTTLAVMTTAGRLGMSHQSVHGFSQILYALSSTANNNGSAFAGLTANTPFYNILLALIMWGGRFGMIIPVLAMAGALAEKKKLDVTTGTLPTHGILFAVLLAGLIVIVGALTYFPALMLGPIAEHLQLRNMLP